MRPACRWCSPRSNSGHGAMVALVLLHQGDTFPKGAEAVKMRGGGGVQPLVGAEHSPAGTCCFLGCISCMLAERGYRQHHCKRLLVPTAGAWGGRGFSGGKELLRGAAGEAAGDGGTGLLPASHPSTDSTVLYQRAPKKAPFRETVGQHLGLGRDSKVEKNRSLHLLGLHQLPGVPGEA